MNIRQISPELAKIARDELGEDPARISADLQAIKDWLFKQSHINARTDDQWLIAFLRGCKFSLEKTKVKLDNYYTMKTMVPEMGGVSDVRDPHVQRVLESGCGLPLKNPICPNGPSVLILRPGSVDPKKMTFLEAMGAHSMFIDLCLLNSDNATIAGYHAIVDFSNVGAGHLSQLTPSALKKLILCSQDGLPLREEKTHFINAPPGIGNILSIAKTFLKPKSRNRFVIHNDGLESLYQYIPREILPVEYGGSCGTIQDNIDYMKDELEKHRDWLLENAVYKTDESKRPGKPKTHEYLFEFEGSFRQLNVD